eukprot:gnl/MRDRNA2_/MRDRNA2_88744_c0_seq1.p1 gnl/MRDRNA2_/MRDRNA2_88744_c0~~gnl/MRDRNA2_/MRDRNA2_88744_c0_seq1.p1  ORF type:complete len:246 (+),score=49.04 gnl/MRDRNA2_/MRDRNA2_88744_c0_seq1:85-822(+)
MFGSHKHPKTSQMVYVSNLPFGCEWQELKDHMKGCGTIEFCNVLTLDGSQWGRSRGIGYVRYSTQAEADHAIATMNGSTMSGRREGESGRIVKVDRWTGGDPELSGGKGTKGKGGDMMSQMMMMMMGGQGKGGYGKMGGFGGKGGQVRIHGEPATMVHVSNLSWKTAWQDLKTHMRQAGQVEFVKILTEDGTEHGRSRGQACVRYSNEGECLNAIQMLNDSELLGRPIKVDRWTTGKGIKPKMSI